MTATGWSSRPELAIALASPEPSVIGSAMGAPLTNHTARPDLVSMGIPRSLRQVAVATALA